MEYSRRYAHKAKKRPLPLKNICIQIKRKMFPHRLVKDTKRCALYARVLRLRSESGYNPVKVRGFYFLQIVLPNVEAYIVLRSIIFSTGRLRRFSIPWNR